MDDIGVVLHVDAFEPRILTMALTNAANIRKHYGATRVDVEMVVNGPAVRLLRNEPGPLRERIAAAIPAIRISACANTIRAIAEEEGAPPVLIPGVEIVPAGVVRLIELQRAGWAYIKP